MSLTTTRTRQALRAAGLLAAASLALSACGGVKTTTGGGGGGGNTAGYPTGNIEMSVGASAGGSSDLISRALSAGMSKDLGVSMPVLNKPGANGALVAKELMGAKPDGYKIAVQNASLFAITPLAVSEAEAIKVDDFDILQGVSIDDYVMVTNPKSGFNSLDDIKAANRAIRYGTTGVGTGAQLASALTFKTAKVDATAVPFDGGAPNLTAVLGNQVDASTIQIGEAIENIRSGKLKALAVFSDQRIGYLQDVPTAKEQGIDVQVQQYRFLTTPKGAPQEVKDRLIQAAKATFATAEYKKFNEENSLTPMEVPGEEVVTRLNADTKRYADLVQQYGIDMKSK